MHNVHQRKGFKQGEGRWKNAMNKCSGRLGVRSEVRGLRMIFGELIRRVDPVIGDTD